MTGFESRAHPVQAELPRTVADVPTLGMLGELAELCGLGAEALHPQPGGEGGAVVDLGRWPAGHWNANSAGHGATLGASGLKRGLYRSVSGCAIQRRQR